MKIDRIRYEELKSTGNFSNRKIAVESVVEEGEDPKQVLDQLKAFVQEELGLNDKIQALTLERDELEGEIQDLAKRVELYQPVIAQLQEQIRTIQIEREDMVCDECGGKIPLGSLLVGSEGYFCSEACSGAAVSQAQEREGAIEEAIEGPEEEEEFREADPELCEFCQEDPCQCVGAEPGEA